MTEKQAGHRMMMEKAIITEEQKQSGRGQVFGLIIAITFLFASVFLIATGKGIYGTILGGVDIVALVYVFVYGKKQQEKD